MDFEYREADSSLVEFVWHTQSQQTGRFTSHAAKNWEIVFTTFEKRTLVTLRGPETKASVAEVPPATSFFGIVFKPGTFMPDIALQNLVDRQDLTLPEATNNAVWLHNTRLEIPTFDNADSFIKRLIDSDMLVHDTLIPDVLQGYLPILSQRTIQRRFVQATGISQGTFVQIERATQALSMLESGASIADVIVELEYYDQPHLTRSLKRFMGVTPAQIVIKDT